MYLCEILLKESGKCIQAENSKMSKIMQILVDRKFLLCYINHSRNAIINKREELYMKRRVLVGILAMVLILLLTGCKCEHEWMAATCAAPKTCQKCGETEGETLPHTWQEATCSAPKTCTVCGATEGEALPHTWQEATCSAPKT